MQVQTEVMGDIHHYAWRARHRNQTVYINKRDGERFGNWTSDQCAVSFVLAWAIVVPVSFDLSMGTSRYHGWLCCRACLQADELAVPCQTCMLHCTEHISEISLVGSQNRLCGM